MRLYFLQNNSQISFYTAQHPLSHAHLQNVEA
jgi:hypothetical protein